MQSPKILLALALVIGIISSSLAETTKSEVPKPSYARTMLKVSRSLPGETEELKVRTSEGNLATLIVKRREKSIPSSNSELVPTLLNNQSSSNVSTNESAPSTTIGYQNVEVDPWNRLQTWSSVSEAKSKVTSQPTPALVDDSNDDSRNWVPLSRSFDSWKPVGRPFSSEPWEQEAGRALQASPADPNSSERLLRYAFLPHEPKRAVRTNIGANLLKNRDAKNVPAEVVVRSEINVKPQPGQRQSLAGKRSPMSLDADGTPVVHGRRVPDEPIDEIQVWRNARVINDQLVTDADPEVSSSTARGLAESGTSFERFFEDVNRRYGKLPADSLHKPRTYRNEVLAAEIYESAEDSYRPGIRKRMLQPEIAANYPNSRLYSPPGLDSKPSSAQQPQVSSPPSVKPGTRAPVLQYAHPELGVQPAKTETASSTKSKKRMEDQTFTEAPILLQQQYSGPAQHHGEHRQKKKYVLNEKNIIDSYNYKNYYPYQQFYGLKRPVVEPPFWVKISEGIKSQFTDGVAKVSELTKPVFDPLVEATRKISENLGLSRASQEQHHAQDKIGSVAATGSSVLIPALGLVASGAALGIGAVAVGRYLDVDVLKRSNNGDNVELVDTDDTEAERALGAIAEQNTNANVGQNVDRVYVLVQEDAPDMASRTKRSNMDLGNRQIQRKGADPIAEIVEIEEYPSRSLDGTTADEDNDVQLQDEDAFAKALVRHALGAIVTKSQADKKQPIKVQTETSRRKRSLSSDEEFLDELQNLERAEGPEANGSGHIHGDWGNTPCAKRIFCEAMVERGSDAYMSMEKKMFGLLRMIQPVAALQVSAHFDEVMEAVRRHDCSVFVCYPRGRSPRSSAPVA